MLRAYIRVVLNVSLQNGIAPDTKNTLQIMPYFWNRVYRQLIIRKDVKMITIVGSSKWQRNFGINTFSDFFFSAFPPSRVNCAFTRTINVEYLATRWKRLETSAYEFRTDNLTTDVHSSK